MRKQQSEGASAPARSGALPRLLIALLAAAGITAAAPVAAQRADTSAQRPTQDQSSALVILDGEPLSTYAKTKPARGKKIDFDSNVVKAYRAQLNAIRNDYRKWLQANYPQAKVSGEFDISLNAVSVQLNGAPLEGISAAALVRSAQYQGLYYRNAVDPDLSLIKAVEAWAVAGGAANAGAGVKVAVVDSGIDDKHPCFSDAGYAAQTQLGDRRFTNNKVISAKVFHNKAGVNRYTPEAIDSHGTHVAGTVACNHGTPATVQGVTIPYGVSGVAPRALLGNYNVFPATVESARSEDILNALEAAYQDGFDVANMSLGGSASGFQDLLTIAVDNLDQANMVVAVAAGNSGPGFGTVESPGSAARALTAGSASVPHFVGAPVTAGAVNAGAATGDFAVVAADLTAALAAVTSGSALSTACTALPAASLTGKIALIARGTCTFSTKIRNAQDAGAVAVLVANNVAGDPAAMASDGTPNQPTVPAYMVSRADGGALLSVNGAATTIGAALSYFVTTNADIMAGSSGQGPTDVDFRVKPDVVAPGVNVLSSVPANACATPPCFAFMQGTSMATPHLTGSAAVVRGQHPDWSAAEVRSAIVNTAERGVLKNFSTAGVETNVNIAGSGRGNLLSAVSAKVALDPVSVSFGAVPSGSGQSRSLNVTVRNLSGGAQTLSLAATGGGAGVTYSLNRSSLTLLANESADVTVTMSAAKGIASGSRQGFLEISAGGAVVAHAALFTFVK
jgi:subtilisin family serine protease